jgi:hypothetical protein
MMSRMENQTGKWIPRLIAASLGAWLSASVANADFETISGIEPEATARWHAGGGQTALRFDPGVMASLNIKISGSELPHKPGHPEEHGQEISSLSTLDIWAPAAAFDGFASGKLTHRGDLVMDYPGGSVSLANFTLRPASPEILELVTESGEVLFTLEYIHMMLYPDDKEMTLENMDIRISPALAARMGEPRYTGIAVGQAFAQTHLQIPTNARTTTTCTTPNWHDGVNFFTDVELLSLGNVQQMAREAGVRVAIAPSASLTKSSQRQEAAHIRNPTTVTSTPSWRGRCTVNPMACSNSLPYRSSSMPFLPSTPAAVVPEGASCGRRAAQATWVAGMSTAPATTTCQRLLE